MNYNEFMKKSVFYAVAVLWILCAVVFCACDRVVPEKIEVASLPSDLTVTLGSNVNLSGGELSVYYSDGSTKLVSMEGLSVRGLNKDALGKQTVVVVYQEKGKNFSSTFEVEVVSPSVSSLTLDTEGVKLDYFEGESFNISNLKVIASFTNGTQAEVTAYEVLPATLNFGITRVGIRYRGVTAYLNVNVLKKEAASLEIVRRPDRTEYFEGDPFDETGFEANVVYNDGSKESAEKNSIRFLRSDGSDYLSPSSPEDAIITVEVETEIGTVSNSFALTVKPILPVAIEAVINDPLVFFEGDFFEFHESERAVVFTVSFNNGVVSEIVGNDRDFSAPEAPLTFGTESVLISYGRNAQPTVSLPVTVRRIRAESIYIFSEPSVKEYYEGEPFSFDGLVLGVFYNNGTTAYLAYEEGGAIECTPSVAQSEEGEMTVTVTYDEQTAQCILTVLERPIVTAQSITILNEDELKTDYEVGDTVDVSAARFSFHLSDGSDLSFDYADVSVRVLLVRQGIDVGEEVETTEVFDGAIGIVCYVRAEDGFGGYYELPVYLPITVS